MASITSLRPRGRESGARARPGATPGGTLLSGDALVLAGVTRAFGALRAVDDVSFSVAAGEKAAILGSNGAGKTTLFRSRAAARAPRGSGPAHRPTARCCRAMRWCSPA